MKKNTILATGMAVISIVILVCFFSAFQNILLNAFDIITEKAKNDYNTSIALR